MVTEEIGCKRHSKHMLSPCDVFENNQLTKVFSSNCNQINEDILVENSLS